MNQTHHPDIYEFRVRGHLQNRWLTLFEGLAISLEDNGDTILVGSIIDQAALHGVLAKVRDLGMPLLSVNRVDPSSADAIELNA